MRYMIGMTIALLATVLAAPAAIAQENPIEAEVKNSLKDLTKPFTLVVRLKLKDGAGAKFETSFAKVAAETRKEKGNLAYDLSRSAKDSTDYLVYERWQNFAALQAHMKSEYFGALLKEIHPILDGAPEIKVFVPTAK